MKDLIGLWLCLCQICNWLVQKCKYHITHICNLSGLLGQTNCRSEECEICTLRLALWSGSSGAMSTVLSLQPSLLSSIVYCCMWSTHWEGFVIGVHFSQYTLTGLLVSQGMSAPRMITLWLQHLHSLTCLTCVVTQKYKNYRAVAHFHKNYHTEQFMML